MAGVHSLVGSIGSTTTASSDAVAAGRGNALAAIAMGLYYNLAVYQNNTAFFIATVPMRMLSAGVFWAQGWPAVAVWEGMGSLSTGLALWWHLRQPR
ncbi:Negative regulator of the PHO system [Purpureocillium lavendulum]|uniref:Negative regulator of the PHO system n=1 Tax=Purpureocillium lavendulum TaxID=1247861 RepID=A0AB34FMW8_9HYPO|nr:Negative regulator of the PHO system [Purpureocillium lavendulum]